MSNDANSLNRLLGATYVPSTQRPQCSNCSHHRVPMVVLTVTQGLRCNLLDAAVSKLGMCQHYTQHASHVPAGLQPRGRGARDPHWPIVREAAASPNGVTNAQVQTLLGIGAHSAGNKLSVMTHCGQLADVKLLGAPKHWFADQAAALAWAAACGARLAAASRNPNPKRRTPGRPANVTVPDPWPALQGEAKPHAEIVYTVAKPPAFVHPYQQRQLPPDPRYPSFAGMGPGLYDVTGAAS